MRRIQRFLADRERFQAPVWVGETGEKDGILHWATTEYLEAKNLGWSFWPWKKLDSRNTPDSIKLPAPWAAVAAYARGGPQPARAPAQQAFDKLLINLRLENGVFFPGVVNSGARQGERI